MRDDLQAGHVILFVMVLIVALLLTTALVLAQDDTPPSDPVAEAAAYCQEQGGTLVTRYPAINTNSSPHIRFATPVDFCEWNDAEQPGIASLSTAALYADVPSLASALYNTPPPFDQGGNPSANPSNLYCDQLGGALNFGGLSAVVSGWVNDHDPADIISVCVFADGSMMEAFTLFYRTGGVVRGADLTDRFRWQNQGVGE